MNPLEIRQGRSSGVTLVEAMIAVIILTFVAMAMMQGFGVARKQTSMINDKAFAAQKVTQMMAEVRSIKTYDITELDKLNDVDFNYILTVKPYSVSQLITDPGDPLSGNPNKRYVRWVKVAPIPHDSTLRKVYIAVYLAGNKELLAEAANLFTVLQGEIPQKPVQSFHAYVLAVGNVPNWREPNYNWQLYNPLQYSEHIGENHQLNVIRIRDLGYGRDPFYAPYLNDNADSDALDPADMRVYFYPTKVGGYDAATDDVNNKKHYDASKPRPYFLYDEMDGKTNYNGTVEHTGIGSKWVRSNFFFDNGNYNQLGASIADQYNSVVRYPDEERLFAIAGPRIITTNDTGMSMRMLVEGMYSEPDKFRNAMIFNLHGDVIPMPPMRNYSDPAKEPVGSRGIRAVTHPERLEYPDSSPNPKITMRVYSYLTDPDDPAFANDAECRIAVTLKGIDLRGKMTIKKLEGNPGGNPSDDYKDWKDNMDSFVDFVDGDTQIKLFKSPLKHGNKDGKGLAAARRLYGLDYIPSFVDDAYPGPDLFTDGAGVKNTARWKIVIDDGALANNKMYTIETRIGEDFTTGTTDNQPTNLSRTYVWVGKTAPITEKYQFMGDARHMPYLDVKQDHGYNWYFGTNPNANGYAGFDRATGLWDGKLNVDVPRYFKILREGLIKSECIWSNLYGQAFKYVSLGGEIGYPIPGFPEDLKIKEAPWKASGGNGVATVDEFLNAGAGPDQTNQRLIARCDNGWYSRFWLGELYPDEELAADSNWSVEGNLRVKTGALASNKAFYRAKYNEGALNITEFTGAAPPVNPYKLMDRKGFSSFINELSAGAIFFNFDSVNCNAGNCSNAVITGTGTETSFSFADYPLKGPEQANAVRPFGRINDATLAAPERALDPYNSVSGQSALATWETYYETKSEEDDLDSAAAVRMSNADNPGKFAALVLSGTPEPNYEYCQLGVATLMRAFMSLGWPYKNTNGTERAGRIPQVPNVQVSSPTFKQSFNNPGTVPIRCDVNWSRWDGNRYTTVYPPYFNDDLTPVRFLLKYGIPGDVDIADHKQIWYWVNPKGGSPKEAVKGSDASAHFLTLPIADSLYAYNWDVSDSSVYPAGAYVLRVECHRQNRIPHYSYHESRMVIARPTN